MVEGCDAALVKKIANNLAHVVKRMQETVMVPTSSVTVLDTSRSKGR
jgi:hypothetical protein